MLYRENITGTHVVSKIFNELKVALLCAPVRSVSG